MSTSTGLYPNLDLWNANKLHYITNIIHIFTLNFTLYIYIYIYTFHIITVITRFIVTYL